MLRDFIDWRRYYSACRMVQQYMPGMHSTYEPLSFKDWRKSELYYRRSWRQILFPSKVRRAG